MNLNFARTFLEVIKAGNLNHAADRLNVTQSTVTTRINALENALGQKLLVRNRSGVALTSAGFKFQRYAEILVQTWAQANYELTLPDGIEGVCNIGCHSDLWDEVGDYFLDYLKRNNPEIAVAVWAGNSDEILRWLSSGMIDVAFLFDQALVGNWQAEPLFDDELLHVLSSEDYDASKYVYVDMGPDVRRQYAEVFPKEDSASVTVSAPSWALGHILKWGGSGYLPHRMVKPMLADGTLFIKEGAPKFYRKAFLLSDPKAYEVWPWFGPAVSELKEHLVYNSKKSN